MTPRVRKAALTAHITLSVGWLGAVAAFLVLSIAGLVSRDGDVVRAVYLAMDLIGRFAIVPLGLTALATGLIQALGTQWGLFRHYWILVKFLLTIGATILLLLHQFTAVAGAARRAMGTPPGVLPEVGRLGPQLVGDAALGLLVLLLITTLSVFKPWGMTRYGRRELSERNEWDNLRGGVSSVVREGTAMAMESTLRRPDTKAAPGLPLGLKIFLAATGTVVVIAFILMHLTGGGPRMHGH